MFFGLKYIEGEIQPYIANGWKREGGILIVFSDSYEYSSLILYQNLTSGIFLKVRCNVESKTVSIPFSYSFTFKSFGLS